LEQTLLKPFHKHDDKVGILISDWNDVKNHIGDKVWIVPHIGNGMGKFTPLKNIDRERIRQYTGFLSVVYGLDKKAMYGLYDYEIWINGDFRTRERGKLYLIDSLAHFIACQIRIEKSV
jgi:hypothetical protein